MLLHDAPLGQAHALPLIAFTVHAEAKEFRKKVNIGKSAFGQSRTFARRWF